MFLRCINLPIRFHLDFLLASSYMPALGSEVTWVSSIPHPASAASQASLMKLVPRPALLMGGRMATDVSLCCDLSLTGSSILGGSDESLPTVDLKDELGSRFVF